MIRFKGIIEKAITKGDKSGWSYILIDPRHVRKLNGDSRKSFRVKGKLDDFAITQTALLPVADGPFMLPFNAAMRKGTGKKAGDTVLLQLELDEQPVELSADLLVSLREEKAALDFFNTLTPSHQQYFSKWIESARTIHTKAKRITMSVIALASHQGYGEMIRNNKEQK